MRYFCNRLGDSSDAASLLDVVFFIDTLMKLLNLFEVINDHWVSLSVTFSSLEIHPIGLKSYNRPYSCGGQSVNNLDPRISKTLNRIPL